MHSHAPEELSKRETVFSAECCSGSAVEVNRNEGGGRVWMHMDRKTLEALIRHRKRAQGSKTNEETYGGRDMGSTLTLQANKAGNAHC